MKILKYTLCILSMLLIAGCGEDPVTVDDLDSTEQGGSAGEDDATGEDDLTGEDDSTGQDDVTLVMPTGWGVEPDLTALTRNAVVDYGVVSGSDEDQTSALQAALDDLEMWGGGNLIIPAGDYHFSSLYMRTGVHVLVSKDATLRPYFPKDGYGWVNIVNMFEFSHTWPEDETAEDYIENCSVSCLEGGGAKYTVDYSHAYADIEANLKLYSVMELGGTTSSALYTLNSELYANGGVNSVRFVRARLVRNFMIADAHIIDNHTTCCGMIFYGAGYEGNGTVMRPTNGVVKNCSIVNACHGYGLCQLHGGKSIYFKDLRAEGGVTLRLEAHNGSHVGLFDIYGYNIYNEYGRAAVMLQPHSTNHGTVTIDKVESLSAAHGVLINSGFVSSSALEDNPYAQPGTFANDCRINNIHAVYGVNAQIDDVDIWIYDPRIWEDDPSLNQYETIQAVWKSEVPNAPAGLSRFANFYQYEGGSYAPVFDNTEGAYDVTCTNVTYEGFPYEPVDGVLYSENLEFTNSSAWNGDVYVEIFKENYKNLDYSLKD